MMAKWAPDINLDLSDHNFFTNSQLGQSRLHLQTWSVVWWWRLKFPYFRLQTCHSQTVWLWPWYLTSSSLSSLIPRMGIIVATMIMMLLWCLRETIHVNNLELCQSYSKCLKCYLFLILSSPLTDEVKHRFPHIEFSQGKDWLKWSLNFILSSVISPGLLSWCVVEPRHWFVWNHPRGWF